METNYFYWLTFVILAFIAGYQIANRKKKRQIIILSDLLKQKETELEKQKNKYESLKTSIGGNPPMQNVPASVAFCNNVDRFIPLLNGVEKGDIEWKAWSDVVIDINNSNLISIWKSVLNKPDAWVRVMASWGLSCDSCIEFAYVKGREELYDNENKTPMLVGHKYIVLSPSWIMTTSEGKKRVIKKGIVKLKN